MADSFKAGDLVQLKSGGPKMTVERVDRDGGVYAVWFAGAKREHAHFSSAALKPATDEPEAKTK